MSTAMPEAIPDIEVWTLTLPDAEAACERQGCDEGAEWRGRQTCCGYAILLCGGHKVRWIENFVKLPYYVCSACDHPMFEVIWTKV